jgi:crossover junction endodeoxyribonuclease RuvC
MKTYSSGTIDRAKPVFIGIDQSYSGFAITALQGESYHTEVYKSDLRGIRRLRDIRKFLIGFLDHYFSIADIAMEGYAFGSQMANMLGELGGMVKLTLLDYNELYPVIVPPTSLKKYATGKGNVQKNQILLHVYKNFNVELPDDNAADSYILAHLVSGQAVRKYEKEVYAKLQTPESREK